MYVGQIVSLQLHVTSNTTTWDNFYNIEIMGCELVYNCLVVCDEGEANVNYRLDPGETGLLVISIENNGQDIAPNVSGIIDCSDPYITIEKSNGAFGTIDINGSATNTEDYYIVSVDPSCPADYLAECLVMSIHTRRKLSLSKYRNIQSSYVKKIAQRLYRS